MVLELDKPRPAIKFLYAPHPIPFPSPTNQSITLQAVFMELDKPRPAIKLLYVTPEQLVKGERLKRVLG